MSIAGRVLGTIALALLLPAIAAAAEETGCRAGPDAAAVAVVATADGLVAERQAFLLAGIALPDAMLPGAMTNALTDALTDAPASAWQAATPEGVHRLVSLGPADRYGRLPVLAFAPDGGLVQEALVRAGRAVVRRDEGTLPCMDRLMAAEAAAQQAGAGLWGDAKFIAKATDAASLSARNGLYALVEGRIVSVGYGSRMVFLDFGRRFRTDFTVLVQQSLVSRLLEAGIPVESLTGRAVRVRGVIEESGGPAIRLTDPLALELLDRAE